MTKQTIEVDELLNCDDHDTANKIQKFIKENS